MKFFAATAAVLLAASSSAFAAPMAVITDRTDNIAYLSGGGTSAYFNGSTRGDSIGSGFNTDRIAVDRTQSGGLTTFTFKISTEFGGSEQSTYLTRYADLFLRSSATGIAAGAFDYAISLGYETANGGLSTAGLYASPTYKTSTDIWGTRSGYVYGGKFVQAGADASTAVATPTVATGGTRVAGASVARSGGPGAYVLDVSFTLADSLAVSLSDGFDLLWGTGDCGNDAVFGTVAAVPEPASLALLAPMLVGLGLVGKRAARKRTGMA